MKYQVAINEYMTVTALRTLSERGRDPMHEIEQVQERVTSVCKRYKWPSEICPVTVDAIAWHLPNDQQISRMRWEISVELSDEESVQLHIIHPEFSEILKKAMRAMYCYGRPTTNDFRCALEIAHAASLIEGQNS